MKSIKQSLKKPVPFKFCHPSARHSVGNNASNGLRLLRVNCTTWWSTFTNARKSSIWKLHLHSHQWNVWNCEPIDHEEESHVRNRLRQLLVCTKKRKMIYKEDITEDEHSSETSQSPSHWPNNKKLFLERKRSSEDLLSPAKKRKLIDENVSQNLL